MSELQCNFAPMEGITGYIYRNAHHKYFPHVDQYFTPFLTPNQNKRFSSRDLKEVLPEHNREILLVPQILTNRAEDFIWMADELGAMGYGEVNLNLGCPSATVVSKHKGAGFLTEPEKLEAFFDEVFAKARIRISIKTRLGFAEPEEFDALLELFNRYPFREIIIHPRVRSDFYKNTPNRDAFWKALSLSENEVWYNGDLFTGRDWETFHAAFPTVTSIMLGRGLVANPGLAGELKGHGFLNKQSLKAFHDEIYYGYRETISGDKNVLYKMKELWFYFLFLFPDSEKYGKKIRKAERAPEYEAAVAALFREADVAVGSGYCSKA